MCCTLAALAVMMTSRPKPGRRAKVRFGVDVTISDVHCTNLSPFFMIVKYEPNIGYDFGNFVEFEVEGFLEIDLNLAKITKIIGINMQRMNKKKKNFWGFILNQVFKYLLVLLLWILEEQTRRE
ncbi:hypothetical protein ACJIZ3_016754 [Penstemon smallii]|uniref:Uncharacterized protein n=1 Tax=Penstemon smallii TaxID=265156 RepID=A0ABD3STS8_9LAMI